MYVCMYEYMYVVEVLEYAVFRPVGSLDVFDDVAASKHKQLREEIIETLHLL